MKILLDMLMCITLAVILSLVAEKTLSGETSNGCETDMECEMVTGIKY